MFGLGVSSLIGAGYIAAIADASKLDEMMSQLAVSCGLVVLAACFMLLGAMLYCREMLGLEEDHSDWGE